MPFAAGAQIFHREAEVNGGKTVVKLHEGWECTVLLEGTGSVEGARVLCECLEAMLDAFPDSPPGRVAVDLAGMRKTPLRAQFIIGRWLLAHRERVERVAVFEGQPIEMKIARAVMAIARMKDVGFFDRRADGLAFVARA